MTRVISNPSKLYEAAHAEELAWVGEHVERLEVGLNRFFMLNLFAPHGFGKSALLNFIWKVYEIQLPVSIVHIQEYCSGEDFDMTSLLQNTLRELTFRLPQRITKDLTNTMSFDDDLAMAQSIVRIAAASAEFKKPLLLLLDDYDALPMVQRRWFETTLLSPLSSRTSAIVIMASQAELRFDRVELRMRFEGFEMSGVSAVDISKSYPQYESIGSRLTVLTGGLPLLTDQALKGLECQQISVDTFHSIESKLIRNSYAHLRQSILREVSEELQETIVVLSLLRRFDVSMLRFLLPKMVPEIYGTYTTTDYLKLIDRLGGWVQWRAQGGYQINTALSITLRTYVISEKRSFYRRVNRGAEEFHSQSWREGKPEYHVQEMLFHHLARLELDNADNSKTIENEISSKLLQAINEQGDRKLEVLISLRNSLRNDLDLNGYISADAFDKIQFLIEQKMAQVSDNVVQFPDTLVVPPTANSQTVAGGR